MSASDEASDPFERLAVFQLGATPAAARVDGEAEPGALAGKGRRDDRNFMLRQFSCEGMLFRDLPRAPAPGAVEIENHRADVFQPDLVEAVIVAGWRVQSDVGVGTGDVAGGVSP